MFEEPLQDYDSLSEALVVKISREDDSFLIRKRVDEKRYQCSEMKRPTTLSPLKA